MGRNSFYLLSVFVILDSIFTIARLQIIVEAVGTKWWQSWSGKNGDEKQVFGN